ncbi:hypothetical protein LTR70_003685 [Exophiala xenobiotica]|uniref:Nucleoside phosphorylase domain-containing protein n=1 Tax=Lithohypha guttulata TaxID=1690604 RepID=A0ABR0KI60_9EURO|nr:hypothetical protein LTR24_002354 [Lithohypha guttulata]KAK5322737.1 hypothetical protein LTR70_003685 [Exophiala xenobiotica]
MSDEKAPTVGYICPLYTEIKAVLASFDGNLPSRTIRGSRYFYGMIRDRKVVAVQFPYKQTGPITAANCAHKLIQAHPSLEEEGSYCLLVGIAGGIWTPETDLRLGDVVIGTRTWDWRTGKTTSQGFVSTEDPKRAPAYLLDGLGEFLYRRNRLGPMIRDWVIQMQTRSSTKDDRWDFPGQEEDILYKVDYNHPEAPTCEDCDRRQVRKRRLRLDALPRVHDGLVASGNTVLKDAMNRETQSTERRWSFVALLLWRWKLVECLNCFHKNDTWQPHAAATAAACARLLIDSLDDHIQPPSCSEINLPLRPAPLNSETRAKPFDNLTISWLPDASRFTPQSTRVELEHKNTQYQVQLLSREQRQNNSSTQGPNSAKPDTAKRTRRLIPAVSIQYEPLLHYMKMLDVDVTIEMNIEPVVSCLGSVMNKGP